jgi:hypothetical protein
MPRLHFEQYSRAGGRILDGTSLVADIRDLRLMNARCTVGGDPLFGTDVPVPLYWQQYTHHQDPERNAGSQGRVECIETSADQIALFCHGTNASAALGSRFELRVSRRPDGIGYVYHVKADLVIMPGKRWHVSPNDIHGEVEFLNLWPHRSFTTGRKERKRFRACCVDRNGAVSVIPHHHLESSDKRDIVLHKGDRFFWLAEEENPVVRILSDHPVSAGVCAYMWDAHFAYRACPDGNPRDLPENTRYWAECEIYSIGRAEGEMILGRAVAVEEAETKDTPIYRDGLNRFSESLLDIAGSPQDAWPWSQEVVEGTPGKVLFSVDHRCGYDDESSLRIDAETIAQARWCATTLGPAFGGSPFGDGKRFRLTALARVDAPEGRPAIGLRLHRAGCGSVFDLHSYDTYMSALPNMESDRWAKVELITPPISPAPDRMHILLEHNGSGTTWFDNVYFEEIE